MNLDKDPLSRLFDMHLAHGQAQMNLANKLLRLRDVERERAQMDDKLFKGGLSEAEQSDADSRFSKADNELRELQDGIKKLVESLTAVPYSCIEEANL